MPMFSLLLSLGCFIGYFLLSFACIRLFKPEKPRQLFFRFMLLFALIYSVWFFTKVSFDFRSIFMWLSGFLCLILACLTTWNIFYSILLGFSGGLITDLFSNSSLRNTQAIIYSYEKSDTSLNRMLNRRLPYLEKQGYITIDNQQLSLHRKGRTVAILTATLYALFSLARGGVKTK